MAENNLAIAALAPNQEKVFLRSAEEYSMHWCARFRFTAGTPSLESSPFRPSPTSAVKRFICQTKRQVTLEVTATLCPNSHLGTIIRYIILEPRSKTQLTEYVDALTEVYPIKADSEIMYAKLMTAFEERQSIKKSD